MFTTKKRMLLALYRIEEQQQAIMAKLDAMEKPAKASEDRWLQDGIDNIMSFQAGKKSGERE